MPRTASASQALLVDWLHAPVAGSSAWRFELVVSRDQVGAVATRRSRSARATCREAFRRAGRSSVACRVGRSRQVLASAEGLHRTRSRSRVGTSRAEAERRHRRSGSPRPAGTGMGALSEPESGAPVR